MTFTYRGSRYLAIWDSRHGIFRVRWRAGKGRGPIDKNARRGVIRRAETHRMLAAKPRRDDDDAIRERIKHHLGEYYRAREWRNLDRRGVFLLSIVYIGRGVTMADQHRVAAWTYADWHRAWIDDVRQFPRGAVVTYYTTNAITRRDLFEQWLVGASLRAIDYQEVALDRLPQERVDEIKRHKVKTKAEHVALEASKDFRLATGTTSGRFAAPEVAKRHTFTLISESSKTWQTKGNGLLISKPRNGQKRSAPSRSKSTKPKKKSSRR